LFGNKRDAALKRETIRKETLLFLLPIIFIIVIICSSSGVLKARAQKALHNKNVEAKERQS
jgi:hypothetical protein